MEGTMLAQMALDDPRTGALSWDCLLALVRAVRNAGTLSEEVKAYLKGRLKSEYAVVVLNTLTVLHTLVLNNNSTVRSQLASSKIVKAAERILNKPQAPGLELAVAQLFFDWSYTYGREELAGRCYQLLNTGKNRVLLSVMAPSDVVVMMAEDRKIGMPRLGLTKGLDFAQMHGDPSLAVPGSSSVSSIMTALAKRALAPLGGGANGASQVLAQYPEGQDEPKVAAEKLLLSIVRMQADMATLAAVERACREVVKQPGARIQLSRHLDDGYVAACRCASWRGKIQALAQSGIDGDRMDRLLAAADSLNAALDAWQAFAADELFRLMGVTIASRTPAVSAAQQQRQQQQRQQKPQAAVASGNTGASAAPADYMDLLTGDSTSSSHTLNPFLAATASGTGAAVSSIGRTQQQPPVQQLQRLSAGSAAASRAAPLDLLTGDDPTYEYSSPRVHYPMHGDLSSPHANGPANPFRQPVGNNSAVPMGSSGSLNAMGSNGYNAAASSSGLTAATSTSSQQPLGRSSFHLQRQGSSSSLQQLSSSSDVQQAPTGNHNASRASAASLQRVGSADSSSSSGGNDTGSNSYVNPFVNIDKTVLAAAGIVPGSSQAQPMSAIDKDAVPAASTSALPSYNIRGGDSMSSSTDSNPFRGPLVQQQRQHQAESRAAPGAAAVSTSTRRTPAAAAVAAVTTVTPSSPGTIQTTPFDPFSDDGTGMPHTPSRLGQPSPAAATAAAGAAPKRQPPAPPTSSGGAAGGSGGSAYPPVPAPASAPAVLANGQFAAAGSPLQRHPQSTPAQQPQAAQPGHQSASAAARTEPTPADAGTSSQQPFLPQLLGAIKQAQEAAGPSSKPGGCCRTCALPPQQALVKAMQGLLSGMQRQHQQELQALQAVHEQQVAGIKATAVARIKELMAAMQQHGSADAAHR